MSVQRTESKPSHPVTTTTTNSATSTTTTTTINSDKAASTSISLVSRPIGWHATVSGFDWDKRSDQHRYRLSIGLPEVHAAVINRDWETASEMLCAEDIGLLWLPAVSQRDSANDGKNTENGAWATKLPSKDQSTRLEAIRQMAMDMVPKTWVEGAGCLYGANLLTLCMQTSVPPEFMQKLLIMIKEKSPQYLNLPDASGRTPLYIAVDQGNEAQVRMLIDAGANPCGACRFSATDPIPTTSAYDLALASKNNNIFFLLVENSIQSANWSQGYPIREDPLKLEQWASLHSESELRSFANQFSCLKSFLFNLPDASGSSIVERTLNRKEILDKDITPLYRKNLQLGTIYAAAVSGDAEAFILNINTYLDQTSTSSKNRNTENLTWIFLKNSDPSKISLVATQCPKLEPFLEQITCGYRLSSLPFKNFSALLTAMWPNIDQQNRQLIACLSGNADSHYTQFIINLPGFAMERNTYASNHMVLLAAQSGNTTAFEFGAAHQDKFDKLVSEITSVSDQDTTLRIQGLAINALHARSLLWFEKLMTAGLNLQALLDSDGETILPLMADLSPARLGTWLEGMTFGITQQTIDDARTAEGRDALLALIQAEETALQKADTEKADS